MRIPIIAPDTIGNKKIRFPFISLKKFNTLSNSFSYNPSTMQITPLLIPGSIAPEPTKIPFIKLEKKFIISPNKLY